MKRLALLWPVLLTVLCGTAAGLYWLWSDPVRLLMLLPRLLPAGTELVRVEDVDLGRTGGTMAHVQLQTGSAMITADDLVFAWRVEGVYPLELTIEKLSVGSLRLALAAAGASDRDEGGLFGEGISIEDPRASAVWPRLKKLNLQLGHVVVFNNTGDLLSAALTYDGGSRTGSGSVQFDNRQLELQWRDSDTQLLADWQLSGRQAAAGTLALALAADNDNLDWQFSADLQGIDPRLSRLTAAGSGNPFRQTGPLVEGSFELSGGGEPLRAQCGGKLLLERGLASRIEVEGCHTESDAISAHTQGTMVLGFDPQQHLSSVESTGISLDARWRSASDSLSAAITARIPPQDVGTAQQFTLAITDIDASVHSLASQLGLVIRSGRAQVRGAPDAISLTVQALADLTAAGVSLDAVGVQLNAQQTEQGRRIALQADVDGLGRLLSVDASQSAFSAPLTFTSRTSTEDWHWPALAPLISHLPEPIKGLRVVDADLLIASQGTLWPLFKVTSSVRLAEGYFSLGGTGVAGMRVAPLDLTLDASGVTAPFAAAVSAEAVQAGFSITRPTLSLMRENGDWVLGSIEAELFGGTLRSERFSLQSNDGLLGELTLSNLDLASIVSFLGSESLEVSGRVSAKAPIYRRHGQLGIDAGTVSGRSGLIRYQAANDPTAPISEPLRVARDALANLNIESLQANVAYGDSGIMTLATQIQGRNPDYQNGREVHLNLTLENNMRTLLDSLRTAERINRWVEQRMSRRQGTNPNGSQP